MSNPILDQFVVDRLTPERQNGGGVYRVTADSVSPTRVIGEDPETGLPIEETVCAAAKAAKFVDPDGNVCEVALRTGRVYSDAPECERYELLIMRDLISQGQLPLASCPHTTEFRHIRRGPLVALPEDPKEAKDAERCQGKPEGCAHMQKVITDRRARARIKWDKHQAAVSSMDARTVEKMMTEFGKLFNGGGTSGASKGALVKGQGERA